MTMMRWMTAVAVVAVFFAWGRIDADSLILAAVFMAVGGPVLAGISFDRARGGLGIRGGAIAGLASFSVLFVVTVVSYAATHGAKNLDALEVLYWFGLAAGVGAVWGAIAGLTAAFCTGTGKAPGPPPPSPAP
jgi:hypothetical protein